MSIVAWPLCLVSPISMVLVPLLDNLEAIVCNCGVQDLRRSTGANSFHGSLPRLPVSGFAVWDGSVRIVHSTSRDETAFYTVKYFRLR